MGRRTGFNVKNNGTTILSNSYTYDNAGRLLSVTSNGKTMSYTYDANGNVLSENGTDIQTSYAYNNANLVTEKTDTKSGNIIDKSYNIQYNLMGNRTRVTDLTTNHNDFYTYTQDGRLVYELKKGANNKISEISYDYDTVGNMTNRCVYYANSNEIYDYDFVYGNYNQLEYTTVEYDDFTNISEYTIQYEYDANGNMIEKTSFDEDYLIESLDTYTFDIFGRMTQSTNDGIATTYTYDGDNLRASKTTNGVTTNHILDGMNVVADITGSTTNSYSRGLSLYASKKGTQTFSYTTNIHGDISTEIDSQNTTKRDYYDNYGNIITEQITDMPFGYTGEYTDTETGLIYLRNRYYDPEICRFISEDPIMDGTNWYSYCDGNPVRFKDPLGTYYIKQNSDGKYTAFKSPWYVNTGKVALSFIPYGDYVSYVIEGLSGVSGGTSKVSESSVLSGTVKTSLFSKNTLELLGEKAGQIAGKALKVYQAYESVKVIYDLGSISQVDNISFYLMGQANISTTSISQYALENKFEKTAAFIGKYSGYYINKFRYGLYQEKTPYEIDMDIASASGYSERSKKINEYVYVYQTSLTQSAKSTFLWPSQIKKNVDSFKGWLESYSIRQSALLSDYKTFMGR